MYLTILCVLFIFVNIPAAVTRTVLFNDSIENDVGLNIITIPPIGCSHFSDLVPGKCLSISLENYLNVCVLQQYLFHCPQTCCEMQHAATMKTTPSTSVTTRMTAPTTTAASTTDTVCVGTTDRLLTSINFLDCSVLYHNEHLCQLSTTWSLDCQKTCCELRNAFINIPTTNTQTEECSLKADEKPIVCLQMFNSTFGAFCFGNLYWRVTCARTCCRPSTESTTVPYATGSTTTQPIRDTTLMLTTTTPPSTTTTTTTPPSTTTTTTPPSTTTTTPSSTTTITTSPSTTTATKTTPSSTTRTTTTLTSPPTTTTTPSTTTTTTTTSPSTTTTTATPSTTTTTTTSPSTTTTTTTSPSTTTTTTTSPSTTKTTATPSTTTTTTTSPSTTRTMKTTITATPPSTATAEIATYHTTVRESLRNWGALSLLPIFC